MWCSGVTMTLTWSMLLLAACFSLLLAASRCLLCHSYASEWGATLKEKLPPTVEDQIEAKKAELEQYVTPKAGL